MPRIMPRQDMIWQNFPYMASKASLSRVGCNPAQGEALTQEARAQGHDAEGGF